jgi:hypothetical protein
MIEAILASRRIEEPAALAAIVRAHRLVLAYNLDHADYNAVHRPLRGFVDAILVTDDNFKQWTVNIVRGVATIMGGIAYSCGNTKHGANGTEHHIICREDNLPEVRLMVEFLMNSVLYLNRLSVAGRRLTQIERRHHRDEFRLMYSQRIEAALLRHYKQVAIEAASYYDNEEQDLKEWMKFTGPQLKDSWDKDKGKIAVELDADAIDRRIKHDGRVA